MKNVSLFMCKYGKLRAWTFYMFKHVSEMNNEIVDVEEDNESFTAVNKETILPQDESIKI